MSELVQSTREEEVKLLCDFIHSCFHKKAENLPMERRIKYYEQIVNQLGWVSYEYSALEQIRTMGKMIEEYQKKHSNTDIPEELTARLLGNHSSSCCCHPNYCNGKCSKPL